VEARLDSLLTGRPAQRFTGFPTSTRTAGAAIAASSARRRSPAARPNPLVVTSLTATKASAQHLYEVIYCARGEMENRIKECQLDLFADRNLGRHDARPPTAPVLRVHGLCAAAYVLLCLLHRIGLAHRQFADATCGTVCLQLLKIGALVRINVRPIKLAMASAWP
jgi:hypothetical protein